MMNYNKIISYLTSVLILGTGCSHLFFVKKDRIISSSSAYIIKSPEQILLVPVKNFEKLIAPEILAHKIAFRIYGGCDLDYVISKGKSFLITERYDNKDSLYKEKKTITLTKCLVNYIKKNKKDLWEKNIVEFEYSNRIISFEAYAEFKGDVINFIDRN